MLLHRAVVAWSLLVACGPAVTDPSASTDDGTTTGAIEPPVDTGTGAPGASASGTSMGTSVSSSDTVATSEVTTEDTAGEVSLSPDNGGSDECDLWAQDCADGEKCNPYANDGGDRWNAARCYGVTTNPAQLGDECVVDGPPTSGLDNCDLGLMCFDVDPATGLGTCMALCGGDSSKPTCDDPATGCTISHDGAVILCLPKCDPVAQDCASASHSCIPSHSDQYFVCFPTYSPSAAAGQPCDYPDSCVPGTMCAPEEYVAGCEAYQCCTAFCANSEPNADLGCPGFDGGEICDAWSGDDDDQPPDPIGWCSIPVG